MQVIPVALALVTPPPPVVNYNGPKAWVTIGANNDFFEQLLQLKKGSVTLTRCLNTRTRLVKGSGFAVDAKKYPNLAAKLKKLDGKQHADQVLGSVAGDNSTFRGRAYQVVWNEAGDDLVEVHYQRFKQVRSGKKNEEGDVEEYWISRDWTKPTGKNKPVAIPAFNPALAKGKEGQKTQLLVRFTESDDIEYYPDPEYWACSNYAQLEKDLSEYHLSDVQNRFTVGTILVTDEEPEPEGNETQEDANKKFEGAIEKKFTGPKGKNFMVMTGVSNPEGTKLLSYTSGSSHELYETYAELCQQKILTANGVTSPVVVGLPGTGSLGGNGNELRSAFELYYNTECRPDQVDICDDFRELLQYCKGLEPEGLATLDITTSLPVRMTFSEAVLQDILPPSRLRKMIDEPELTPAEKEELQQDDLVPDDNGQGLKDTVLNALRHEA